MRVKFIALTADSSIEHKRKIAEASHYLTFIILRGGAREA